MRATQLRAGVADDEAHRGAEVLPRGLELAAIQLLPHEVHRRDVAILLQGTNNHNAITGYMSEYVAMPVVHQIDNSV